jgi:hypothetical protein
LETVVVLSMRHCLWPWLTSEELSHTLLKSLQQRQAQGTSFNNNNIRAEEIPHFGSFNQNPVAGVGG